MTVQHLPPTTTAADIAAALDVDGCVVVDELAGATIDQVRDELAPFLETTPFGPDSFSGRHTRRTGGLIARSPAENLTHEHDRNGGQPLAVPR